MNDPGQGGRGENAWALVRLLLGLAQVMGATAAGYLILTTGVNLLSLVIASFTCLCTSISVAVFGGRGGPRRGP